MHSYVGAWDNWSHVSLCLPLILALLDVQREAPPSSSSVLNALSTTVVK